MSVNPQAPHYFSMREPAKDRMASKLQLLKLLDIYRKRHDYSHEIAALKFCAAYNAGELAVDDELKDEHATLSPATLKKWRLKVRNDGVASLGGEYGNRKGKNSIDAQPELRDHIIGFLIQYPHARATRIVDFIEARFAKKESVELPSKRTVQRWVESWKDANQQTYTAITNPDKWKNKFKAAFGSISENIVRLNQLWELDTTPADIQLTDGRYCLAGGIDVYSRRGTILVTKTARSNANAQLLRKKILAEGKPECVKTDQGKDYVSHEFDSFLAAVEIEHAVSNKFSPWEKGHVERFFHTFSHDLLELLPGYSGHNVADAQALRASKSFAERLYTKNDVIEMKMTAAELQTFCDQWCDNRYAHRAHGELGKTPFAMAAEWPEPIVNIEDERALDLLLLEIPGGNGTRVVQKKGIRLPDGWFIAPELEAHIGRQVHCRYIDAGRVVCYGGDPMQFICIAVEPDLAGFSRQVIATKTREIQKRRVQDERSSLRAIERKINAKDAAAEILRSNAIESGVLTVLRPRAETITTPALDAAAELRTALDAPRVDSSSLMSPDEFSVARERAERKRETEMIATPVFDSPIERAYWIANQSFKRALSGEEQSYVDHFRKTQPREAKEMDAIMTLRHGGADDALEA